jgi:hypothetical protein
MCGLKGAGSGWWVVADDRRAGDLAAVPRLRLLMPVRARSLHPTQAIETVSDR